MNTHYTRIAQALHWLMAVLLIGMLSKEGKSHQIAGEARELLERVRHLNAANKNYHVYTAALNRIMGGR